MQHFADDKKLREKKCWHISATFIKCRGNRSYFVHRSHFFSLSKFLCSVLITIVWVQMFWWTHSLLDKYPNEQVPFFADICQNRKNEMVQGTCRHLEGPNPTGLIQVGMHLSLLGFYPETWQVCKLSINLLTLAGLSTNISADKPATVSRCMVKS